MPARYFLRWVPSALSLASALSLSRLRSLSLAVLPLGRALQGTQRARAPHHARLEAVGGRRQPNPEGQRGAGHRPREGFTRGVFELSCAQMVALVALVDRNLLIFIFITPNVRRSELMRRTSENVGRRRCCC